MMLKSICKRIIVVVVSVSATISLLELTYAGGLRAAVQDFNDYSELKDQLSNTVDRDRELNQQFQSIVQRTQYKHSLLNQVIDGQLSLEEAAKEFALIHKYDEHFVERAQYRHHNVPESMLFAYSVIDFVEPLLKNDPEKRKAVLKKLRRELRRLEQSQFAMSEKKLSI